MIKRVNTVALIRPDTKAVAIGAQEFDLLGIPMAIDRSLRMVSTVVIKMKIDANELFQSRSSVNCKSVSILFDICYSTASCHCLTSIAWFRRSSRLICFKTSSLVADKTTGGAAS